MMSRINSCTSSKTSSRVHIVGYFKKGFNTLTKFRSSHCQKKSLQINQNYRNLRKKYQFIVQSTTNGQSLDDGNSSSDDSVKTMLELLKQSQESSEQIMRQIKQIEENSNQQYQQLQTQFDTQKQFANLQFEILQSKRNQDGDFQQKIQDIHQNMQSSNTRFIDIQQQIKNLSLQVVYLEQRVKTNNDNNSGQFGLLQDLERKLEQLQTKINQSDGNKQNFGEQAEKALDRLNNKISQHSFLNDENTKYSELNKEVIEVQNQLSKKSKLITELEAKIINQQSTIDKMQQKNSSEYDSNVLYKVIFSGITNSYRSDFQYQLEFKVYVEKEKYKKMQYNLKDSYWIKKLCNESSYYGHTDETFTYTVHLLDVAGFEIKRLVMTSEDVKVDTIEIEVQTTNQGVQVFRGVLGFSLIMSKKFDIPIYITKEAADTLITNHELYPY